MYGIRALNADVQMMFVKSWLTTGGFCLSLDEHDWALTVLRAWQTEGCIRREKRVYGSQEFRAQKKLSEKLCAHPRVVRRERVGVGSENATAALVLDKGRE